VVVTVEFDNIEAEIVLESLREYRKLHECCLAAETGGCWAAETGESSPEDPGGRRRRHRGVLRGHPGWREGDGGSGVSELTFDGAAVLRELQHSLAATERRPNFGQQQDGLTGTTTPPGLWLVKDDGIYVMSNAVGFQPVYAQGYRAGSPGVWDRARDAVGGDDFCEFIDAGPELVERLSLPGSTMLIRWGDDSFEVAA
jgi:hypothetical protein